LRESDVTETPVTAWSWLERGWSLVPEALDDRVRWDDAVWSNPDTDGGAVDPWRLAFSTGVRPLDVHVGGHLVWSDGLSTRVDGDEIRAKAAEQAARLFARL